MSKVGVLRSRPFLFLGGARAEAQIIANSWQAMANLSSGRMGQRAFSSQKTVLGDCQKGEKPKNNGHRATSLRAVIMLGTSSVARPGSVGSTLRPPL